MTISDVLRKYHVIVTVGRQRRAKRSSLIEKKNTTWSQRHQDARQDRLRSVRRGAQRHPSTPVILMTGFGYDPNHSIVRASQEGLQAVLFKPFKVDQLIAEVPQSAAVAPPAGQQLIVDS